MDLDLKHRPTSLKEVVGQEDAVRVIKGLIKKGIPHKLAFSGPSGCGKTTLARIVAKKLGCDPDFDFLEINCADKRGIELIRELRTAAPLSPANGDCKVYLLDEAHKMTSDAQSAALKLIEEPPSHVYFILATTEWHKLLRTIQTRVTNVVVKSVDDDAMHDYLVGINEAEKKPVSDNNVLEKIVEVADGSVRMAVKMFESIMGIEDSNKQLQAIQRQDTKRQAIEIARILFRSRPLWKSVTPLLKAVDDEPEKIRHMILGYCNAIILNNWKLSGRAAELIELFRDPWYDCGKSGLYASCYQACRTK